MNILGEQAECAAHRHHIMGEKKRPLMQNALFFAIKTIEAAPEGGCAVVHHIISCTLKFIYSEKATKFCKISTLLLTVCTVVKSKVEISQNFVAFSENMNFNYPA